MKDKFASTGLALMLIGACCMDSENLSVPVGLMGVGFALFGIAAAMELAEQTEEKAPSEKTDKTEEKTFKEVLEEIFMDKFLKRN